MKPLRVLMNYCVLSNLIFFATCVFATEKKTQTLRRNGFYKINLGYQYYSFSELKYFSELYSDNPTALSFQAGRYFFTSPLTIGAGMSLGLLNQSGKAVIRGGKEDFIPITDFDHEEQLSLTVVPVQFLVLLQYAPTKSRNFTIDLYFGYEDLYFQEIRKDPAEAVAATITNDETNNQNNTDNQNNPQPPQVTTPNTDSSDEEKEPNQMNVGWNSHYVIGGSINWLLNPIDHKSTRSSKITTTFGNFYLSPFFEVVVKSGMKKALTSGEEVSVVSFARSSFGVGFTFENI